MCALCLFYYFQVKMTGWFMYGSPLKRRFQTVNEIEVKKTRQLIVVTKEYLAGVYKAQGNQESAIAL